MEGSRARTVPGGRREVALLAVLTCAATIGLLWGWSWPVTWNDYSTEAAPSLQALLHGHLLTFLQTAPPYGPSLLLRAPFALPGSLLGAGAQLVYRLSALPCLLALDALGVWLARDLRRAGGSRAAAIVTVALCAVNPINYRALQLGHPEDLLGAALCVAAVLLAARRRWGWAALALGLAIANKEWALLAVGPVFLATDPTRRLRTMVGAAGVAGALLAPIALASGSLAAAGDRIATSPVGTIFHPQQVFYFFAQHGDWHPKLGLFIPRAFLLAPPWLGAHIHVIIVALGLPLTMLAWRRRTAPANVMLLLAGLLLARCYLDPWDATYYPLPFTIALLAWETTTRAQRLPVFALIAAAANWWLFWFLPPRVNEGFTALSFIVVATVGLGVMAVIVYRLAPARRGARSRLRRLSRAPAVPS